MEPERKPRAVDLNRRNRSRSRAGRGARPADRPAPRRPRRAQRHPGPEPAGRVPAGQRRAAPRATSARRARPATAGTATPRCRRRSGSTGKPPPACPMSAGPTSDSARGPAALVSPASSNGVTAPRSAAARIPGRKPATASSALVPVATWARPSESASGREHVEQLGLAEEAAVGAVGAVAISRHLVRRRRQVPHPSDRSANRRASSSSVAGKLAETAVAATTLSAPRTRTAAASRNAESAPPLKATRSDVSSASRASSAARDPTPRGYPPRRSGQLNKATTAGPFGAPRPVESSYPAVQCSVLRLPSRRRL